jgi:hypothetical protein
MKRGRPAALFGHAALFRFLQPAADGGLVARILVVEVALEELFFPWDHNQRNEAGSGRLY